MMAYAEAMDRHMGELGERFERLESWDDSGNEGVQNGDAAAASNGLAGKFSDGVKRAEAYWGDQNVGTYDRIASGVAGAALTIAASKASGAQKAALAAAGGYLLLRGATGHCLVNHALRTGSNRPAADEARVIPHGQGIKVEKSVQIMRPASELYDFWHQFDNLPKFMKHLESVTILDGAQSHWVAKAPFGQTVEWDAEIIADKPNEKTRGGRCRIRRFPMRGR